MKEITEINQDRIGDPIKVRKQLVGNNHHLKHCNNIPDTGKGKSHGIQTEYFKSFKRSKRPREIIWVSQFY